MRRPPINFKYASLCFFVAVVYLISNEKVLGSEKSMNFRVQQAPFLFFPALTDIPMAQIEFMFRPNKHLNLGFVGNTFSDKRESENDTYSLNINSAGFRVDFVLNSDAFSDGFYISNFLMVGMWNSEEESESTCGATIKSGGQSSITGGSFGYQWFWSNGYNLNVGVGLLELSSLTNEQDNNGNCTVASSDPRTFSATRKNWIDLGFGFSI